VWGLGRSLGARVLLRIEDHDAQRSRREYEAALLDDLDWLGFRPGEYPTHAFRAGRCESRQSDRHAIYDDASRALNDRGLVYACDCSRQRVRDVTNVVDDVEPRYPGTCREKALPFAVGLSWRLRLEPQTYNFDDLLCGRQTQTPADQCGDVMIRDRLGNWTYQFVAAVDDLLQEIDLVIRGRDLLASTGRQMQIAELLGRRAAARFAHHGLLMKSPTQKLSKSDGDSGVRDLRARGWTAARVVGHAALQAGLITSPRDIDAADVASLFTA
jgi:glutamyl-tRNA synthetase/glutamyl-Q tRNA(Asp) synthetase